MRTTALKWANRIAFYGYAWFLVVIGGVLGILVPRWGPLRFEVFARAIFKLDLPTEVVASTLNQYRFMKTLEFSFGVFALLFREEIYTVRKFNRFFLVIVFMGAGARLLSIIVDGQPHAAYIGFTIVESAIGLIIWWYSRSTLAAAEARRASDLDEHA